MTDSISLTIPLNHSALTRASDMLLGVATDLQRQCQVADFPKDESFDEFHQEIIKSVASAYEVPVEMLVVDPALAAQTEAEDAFAPEPYYPGSMFTDPDTEGEPVPMPVKLDKNGLPWDERIHAGTKSKKGDGNWKNKRSIDPAIIAQVEAELRAAMSVPTLATLDGPTQFVNDNILKFQQLAQAHDWTFAYSDDARTFNKGDSERKQLNIMFNILVEDIGVNQAIELWNGCAPDICKKPTMNVTPNATTPTETVTPVLPVTVPGITTLPQLMAAATGAGKTPQDMQSAAAAAGLASVALLGARPDLIPTVAASLGLGG